MNTVKSQKLLNCLHAILEFRVHPPCGIVYYLNADNYPNFQALLAASDEIDEIRCGD